MRLLVTISLLLVASTITAQDIHFSQFYNSPINLNPALTGRFNGNLRGVMNHRSQWASIAEPYQTSAISIDSRLFSLMLDGKPIGVGLSVLNDVSGPADLRFFRVLGAVSYAHPFGWKKRHKIGVGAQGGIFQRSIDESKLIFESQFEDTEFKADRASGEVLGDFNTIKADVQFGVSYWFKSRDVTVNGGLATFHIAEPNESILDELSQLSRRYILHGGSQFNINDRSSVGPSLLVVTQNKAREITIGGLYYYQMAPDEPSQVILNFGAHYRVVDAFIFQVGASYKKWQAAFSYDINVSSLAQASNYKGGFELSLIYIDRWLTRENSLPVIVPCPRL
jgi:type IX secretion system PorP/SprF family membrane protein